nr:hypothetical protein BaRGS_030460 [Batillaria attramentaria]
MEQILVDQEDICLPVYVRCNDVYDCPGHEDEADCDTYTCPGFYRCRASRVCVHRDHVCDGNYHCPQRDDELFCQLDCPDNSDLLMGVYLAMIGVADRLYQGTYLWEDVQWRNSVACKVAGFLSLLSNEASAFIICLITADRFVVTRFPFSSGYASGVMIVLNFLLFLLIAVGQGAVYASIRGSSMGLLGLLASQDVPVSGELNVGMAILVLPLNAALNPFLYTLNILLERRRKAREERMLKQLLLHWEQDTDIHKP